MATDLKKSKFAKATSGATHDAFVNAQLARAEKRIRFLDVVAALLGFAALLCVFTAVAALADRAWLLPAWVRQLGLVAFLIGGGAYLYVMLARPLLYHVNPYYAAQVVEQTMPGAKNSVVNWLDLQQREEMPPAIRTAVGQKAAKDLSKADVEHAFSTRRILWVGVTTGICAVGLVACLTSVGDSFFHLKRIFTPFSFGSAEPRTTITLTKPENGDAMVTMGQAVTIAVRVDGKIPDSRTADAVRVLYRYQPDEPYKTPLPMHQDGNEYSATIQPGDVSEGFWYKVVAGEAETPEYHITVRGRPLLTHVNATYHFRPYVGRYDELHFAKRTFKLEALRGTEITLAVHTNRPVKEAYLVILGKDGKDRFPAEVDAQHPNAFAAKLVVEQSLRYGVEYTTVEGESYTDQNLQELVAIPDLPPNPVELRPPAANAQLPCNGLLQVEGSAADDIGVKSLALRMRVVSQGLELKDKAYRSDKELRLTIGGYAQKLAYKDYVDLNTVQSPDGKLLALQKDMELEYWLVASDACDFPKANVSESKHYRVKLTTPDKNQQNQRDQRNQAKQDQQKHDARQDEALRNEAKNRFEDQQRRNDKDEDKPGEKNNTGANANENQKEKDKRTEDAANDIKNKLDKAKADEEKGSQPSAPKEGQDAAPSQAKGAQGDKKPQPSEGKPQGKPEDIKDAGSSKSGPQQGDPMNAPANDKPEGKQEQSQKPGESKPEASSEGAPKSAAKDNAPPKPEQHAESKGAPSPQEKKDAGKEKPEVQPSEAVCEKADCKNDGKTTNTDAKNAKPKPDPSPASNASQGKNEGGTKSNEPKAQQKAGANKAGEAKSGPKPEEDAVASSELKQDGGPGSPEGDPRSATPGDVANQKQKLNDGDRQQRKQAEKQLDKISKEASNEEARAQAQKALEDAGLKEPGPAAAKKAPSESSSENKGSPDNSTKDPSSVKSAPTEKPPAEGKEFGKPTLDKTQLATEKKQFGGTKPEGDQNAEAQDGHEGDHQESKASTLQLQEFFKSVDKKMLQDAGLTEEQWREFLKNYADKASRDAKTAKETVPGPKTGTLGSTGSDRVNPGATKNSNTPQGPGNSKAPPAYREAWERFKQDLNSTDDKK